MPPPTSEKDSYRPINKVGVFPGDMDSAMRHRAEKTFLAPRRDKRLRTLPLLFLLWRLRTLPLLFLLWRLRTLPLLFLLWRLRTFRSQ
jgi:hypothetical protein